MVASRKMGAELSPSSMLLLTMLRTLNTAAKVIDNRANLPMVPRTDSDMVSSSGLALPAGNAVTL